MDGVDLSVDSTARNTMSYVMQNELFFEDLTLRETLVVSVCKVVVSWFLAHVGTHTCKRGDLSCMLTPCVTIACQAPPGTFKTQAICLS